MSLDRWRQIEAMLDRPAWEVADHLLPDLAGVLKPGSQLGPYRIESLLGAGGMGEVYRATDTRLNRPVAIKFLLTEAADESARRRFQQEAKTASSLNHPHILTVFEAGEIDNRDYLVTEFVDDGTLRDWLRANKPSWRQTVNLLIGVADGLACAHTAGILHRDIKPDNILVSANGYAKLADFGLAKLLEPLDPATSKPGPIIGTIAYMSPEQASGRTVDARGDIFSFAIVLFEALTGKRPFEAKTGLELLQEIIHSPAPQLPQGFRYALRLVLDKALEKDPADRYQTMKDLVVDLRRISRQNGEDLPRIIPRRSSTWIAGSALAIAAAVFTGYELRSPNPAPKNPLSNAKFTRVTDFEGAELQAEISPDGRFLAFLSDRDGPFDIFLTQVGTGRFVNLTQGREGELLEPTRSIGFSGDGSEIWLRGGSDSRLRLMPLVGGTTRPFLDQSKQHVVAISWSPDNTRVVYHGGGLPGDPIFVADRNGGGAKQVFIDPNPGGHCHFPVWSTDGKWIYFVRGNPATFEMDIWRISPVGGPPARMTHHNANVAYPAPIDSNTVLYVAPAEDGSGPWLYALDVGRKSSRRVSFGLEQYRSVAATGNGHRVVATVANPSASLWSVPILDHPADEKQVMRFAVPTVRALAPRFGGGGLFYLSSLNGGDGLWRYRDNRLLEIWRGMDAPLFDPAALSLDGKRVALAVRRQGKVRLELTNDDGTGAVPLSDSLDVRGSASWSADGRYIAIGGVDADGPGLFKIRAEGGAPVRLTQKAGFDPVWSPDGNLIVYSGSAVGRYQVLLAVSPDGAPVHLPEIRVRTGGERYRFLPNGKGLVYMAGLQRRQDFSLLDLSTMNVRRLTNLTDPAAMRTFDITPDGKQIVFDRLRENSDVVLIDVP